MGPLTALITFPPETALGVVSSPTPVGWKRQVREEASPQRLARPARQCVPAQETVDG
jgi:hypothetical protein